MDFPKAHLVKIVFICAFILSQICVIDARTRYEEFETSPEDGQRLCVAASKRNNQPVDTSQCREFCETKTSYSTGGCDCKTLKCVCADMSLDFCDFSRIRLFI